MQKRRFFYFALIAALLSFSACSLVKNTSSANFSRVKYNAHLKLPKSKKVVVLPKTVESFELEAKNEQTQQELNEESLVASNSRKAKRAVPVAKQTPKKEGTPKATQSTKVELNTIIKNQKDLLKEVEPILLENQRATKGISYHDHWWEDDPEDWPWGEIVLAVVAVLLIAIVIVVLVDLIGGIIAGLLGLILLLALAYCLYFFWIA